MCAAWPAGPAVGLVTLAVISWLKGDPRLQVLLLSCGADRSEALLDLGSPGKEAKEQLQSYT